MVYTSVGRRGVKRWRGGDGFPLPLNIPALICTPGSHHGSAPAGLARPPHPVADFLTFALILNRQLWYALLGRAAQAA